MNARDLLDGKPCLPEFPELNFSKLKVYVTGAAGTLGGLLMARLNGKCLKLVGVDASEEKVVASDHPDLYVGQASHFQAHMIPDLVFHCAAYKHVHLGNRNRAAFHENNVWETHRLVESLSFLNPRSRVILASTDKASGSSYMGQTKAQAEEIVERFGGVSIRLVNLVRSSGSVVPRWEAEVKRRKPVLYVVQGATRYWMQASDACNALLYASLLPAGRYTVWGFPKVSVEDMALAVIDGDKRCSLTYMGARPEEVLEERLVADTESVEAGETPWIRRIVSPKKVLFGAPADAEVA